MSTNQETVEIETSIHMDRAYYHWSWFDYYTTLTPEHVLGWEQSMYYALIQHYEGVYNDLS